VLAHCRRRRSLRTVGFSHPVQQYLPLHPLQLQQLQTVRYEYPLATCPRLKSYILIDYYYYYYRCYFLLRRLQYITDECSRDENNKFEKRVSPIRRYCYYCNRSY